MPRRWVTLSHNRAGRTAVRGWCWRVLCVATWVLGTVTACLAAEDPPAPSNDPPSAPSRQELLARRQELVDAAHEHAARRQFPETVQCLEQAVDVCQRIDSSGTDSDNVGVLLTTYQELCQLHKGLRNFAELLRASQEALAAQRTAREQGQSDACDTAVFMLELGVAQVETGAYDDARSTLLAARDELRTIVEEDYTEGVYLLDTRICLQLANSDFRQGHLQAADQQFANAETVARAALAKFGSIESRRQLANCLYARARALRLGDRCGLARPIAVEAHEVALLAYLISRLQSDAVTANQCQVLVGLLCRDIGDLPEAKRLLEAALVKLDGTLSPLSSSVNRRQVVLQHLLAIAIDEDENERMVQYRDLLLQSLASTSLTHNSPFSPSQLSEVYRFLGRAFLNDGRISESGEFLRRAFDAVNTESPNSSSFEGRMAMILAANDLAEYYSLVGRIDDAGRVFEGALGIAQDVLSVDRCGELHTVVAMISQNAAGNCWLLGETNRALELFERSVSNLELLLADPAYSLNVGALVSAYVDMARLLRRERRFAEAEHCLQRALSASQQGTRFYHNRADIQQSVIFIEQGRLKRAQGAYAEARNLFQKAQEISQRRSDACDAGDQFGMAQVLVELGRTSAAEQDFAQALDYFRQSLDVRSALFPKSGFPTGHPSIANVLREIGMAHLGNGDPLSALSVLQESASMEQAIGEAFAGGTSEAQLLNLASIQFHSLGPLLEAWGASQRPADDVYPYVWLRHGFVARVTAARQRELRELSVSTSPELHKQYLAARQDLARALLVSLTDDHDQNSHHRELLQELNAAKERLERQLTSQFDSAADPAIASTDIQQLQRLLPAAAVFVDFFACPTRPYDATVPDRADPRRECRFFAFIVSKNRPVRCVELGDAQRIGDLVNAWSSSLIREEGQLLREAVWDPITMHFPEEAETIYIAPDAQLAAVAWAALPGKTRGQYLLDHFSIAVVPYGAFLLEQLSRRSSGSGDYTPLLAVADVDYGGNRVALADNRDGLKNLLWNPLPGTRTEVEVIRSLWPPASTHLLTGAEATLNNVLQQLPTAHTLHFATHGFYIDDQLISQLELLAAQSSPSPLTINRSRSSVLARSPLLRSGLVLAGANQQVRLDERGLPRLGDSILSGEAVITLNMEHSELVVLSACDSGQGDPTMGDGAWGMPSAFHAAGARNVVARLWKVSDQAAAKLMSEFYRQLAQGGVSPLQALRSAQLTIAREASATSNHRGVDLAQTLPVAGDVSHKPADADGLRDWAGFFLSGPGF